MNPLIAETVEALRGAGWLVELEPEPRALPSHIVERYPDLPPLAVEFFTSLRTCESASGGCWLLTAANYAEPSDPDSHSWDSFEDLSNADTNEEARAFWDHHLILFQLVDSDYEFLALCLDRSSPNFGKVVGTDLLDYSGSGPEADSYEEFLTLLRDAARLPPTGSSVEANSLVRLVHEEIIDDGAPPPRESGLLPQLGRWFRSGR